MNNLGQLIAFVFLNYSILLSQNEFSAQMRIQTASGLCLDLKGEVWKRQFHGQEFLSGEFAIRQCGAVKSIGSVGVTERVFVDIMDSCVMFEYATRFFNPTTKEYGDLLGYRRLQICQDENAAISFSDKYDFSSVPLSDAEILSFVSSLDAIVANDSLLLDKVNGYGFVDMLFYCSIAGNKKAEALFLNLIAILKERNLLSEYGGEPAQIHHKLKVIFENLEED